MEKNTKTSPQSLYDRYGRRKYLTSSERKKFLEVSNKYEDSKGLFFKMLYYSGARISEVLGLKVSNIDFAESVVVIECLKKRKRGVYRVVPLPTTFILLLKEFVKGREREECMWNFSRRTASRYIKAAMDDIGVRGSQATAKGLRHGFAVCAIENNVPLNLIKRWMGHASITTTEIYLEVIGQEERRFAERMWKKT